MKKNSFKYSCPQGFTLLELVVTILLVGLLSTVTGTVIGNIAEGYIIVKENNRIAQKAHLAIYRLVNELTHITQVTWGKNEEIQFVSRFNNLKNSRVYFQRDQLCMDDYVLVNNVDSFQIQYLKGPDSFRDNVFRNMVWEENWSKDSTAIRFSLVLRSDYFIRNYEFKNIIVYPRFLTRDYQ